MTADTMVWTLVAGVVSGATGLGATLVLPALLASGMPLAHAMLVIKLPIALGDLAASISFTQHGQLQPSQLRGTLVRAGLAAAIGAALLVGGVAGSGLIMLAMIVGGDFIICCLRRRYAPLAETLIALYIGALGCGAGALLFGLGRFVYGVSIRAAIARARAVGAAANLAALAVIALLVTLDWRDALLLAALQAAGSYLGASLIARSREWTARPAVLTIGAESAGKR